MVENAIIKIVTDILVLIKDVGVLGSSILMQLGFPTTISFGTYVINVSGLITIVLTIVSVFVIIDLFPELLKKYLKWIIIIVLFLFAIGVINAFDLFGPQTMSCTEGATRCVYNALEICEDKAWNYVTMCVNGCENGACVYGGS